MSNNLFIHIREVNLNKNCDYRRPNFWMVIRECIKIAACIDVLYIGIFWIVDSPVLAWVNLLSLTLYVVAYYSLILRKNGIAVALIWIEVLGHATLGTYLIGWDSGFHYYLLMFIPAVFVANSRLKGIFAATMLWCFYIGMNIASEVIEPLDPLPTMHLDIIRYFNISMVFAMCAALCSRYVKDIAQTHLRLHNAYERMSRFSSDVAHEVRTPLTALINQGELVLRNSTVALDENTLRFMDAMLEESLRLGRMVDRLLLIARADQNKINVTLSAQRLYILARDVINIMNVLAEERGVTIKLQGDFFVSAFVDADLLRQILIDLIDNAIQYTQNLILITISTEECSAKIDILDNGPGIPLNDRERMLQRFARGTRTGTRSARRRDGFGLGLSIVLTLTHLQGGSITLNDANWKDSFSSGLLVSLRFALDEDVLYQNSSKLD